MFSILLVLAGPFFLVTGVIGLFCPGAFVHWELKPGRSRGKLRIYAIIDVVVGGLFLYLGLLRFGFVG